MIIAGTYYRDVSIKFSQETVYLLFSRTMFFTISLVGHLKDTDFGRC
jgi:hypothetical protein